MNANTTNTTQPKLIGLDPGYGNFKSAYIEGKLHTSILPAVVGSGRRGKDWTIGIGEVQQAKKPFELEIDGLHYLAGHNVQRYAPPIQRLDVDRLSHGPELKALLYASLYDVLGPGEHSARLLIGLPVEVYRDDEELVKAQNNLDDWLIGGHCFRIEDQFCRIEIERYRLTAQPLGAVLNYGMDLSGLWQAKDAQDAPFAVGDIGENSFDPFVVEGPQVSQIYTDGSNLGMRQALQVLHNEIKTRYGINKSFYECNALILKYQNHETAIIHHNGGSDPVNSLIKQALDQSFGELATEMAHLWDKGRQFRRLIFVGGGAEIHRENLTRLYPFAIVPNNPILANAVGLAKYAQRKGIL